MSASEHFPPAYVKLLPQHLYMVEVVCAWLGHELGLPMPPPVVAHVRRSIVGRLASWGFARDAVDCFGTREIPNALPLQRLDHIDGQVEQLLSGWPECLRVGIFDELIANDDRNKGNLLIDGDRKIWAIDHSRSLRAGGQAPFSDPLLPFQNALLGMFTGLPLTQRINLRQKVTAYCGEMSTAARRVPYSALGVTGEIRVSIERVLDTRAQHLQSLVLARLGIGELPMSDSASPNLH